MPRTFHRPLVAALVGLFAVTSAGCFGQFRLVRTVYDFNAQVPNKLVRSLVTFAFVVIPVYVVAGFVDWAVLNVIDFWAGGGVAESKTLPDGTHVAIERVAPDVLRVSWTDASGRGDEVEVVKVGERAGYVRRPGGAILATIEQTTDGRIVARGEPGLPTGVLDAAGARQ